jgi:hypothetical protein
VNSPTFIGGPAVYELGGPAVYSLGGPAVIYVYYIPAAPLGSIEYQVPVAEKCPQTPLPAIKKMESQAVWWPDCIRAPCAVLNPTAALLGRGVLTPKQSQAAANTTE